MGVELLIGIIVAGGIGFYAGKTLTERKYKTNSGTPTPGGGGGAGPSKR